MEGPDEIIRAVSLEFDVDSIDQNDERIVFRIRDLEFEDRFAALAQRLEGGGIACQIGKKDGNTYIVVRRLEARKQGRLASSYWLPRVLFATVVGFVMVDGYYRTQGTNAVVHIGDPLEMAVVYTACLLGILGVHELGHLALSRLHRIKTTWPYFIPGLPIIGIPTFGALIMAKGLMINRKMTFDVAIAGPIAGLAVAVAVGLYGAWAAPVIDPQTYQALYESQQLAEWQFGEPILMKASMELFGKGDGGQVLMTPVLFAAWVGFFLTFANLMPAGQLDGGHMARTVLGRRALRWLTYASAGVLVLMNFWFVALFVLFMSGRNSGAVIMDDVTPLSGARKAAYAGVMVAAVLCAPIPDSLTALEPLIHLLQQAPSA